MSHAHTHSHGVEALANNQPHNQQTRYQKYAQNLRGAVKRIRVAATQGIVEDDIFGLRSEALASPPGTYDFPQDSRKEAAFRDWLDEQLENDVLEEFGSDNRYIATGYERGMKDADALLRKEGIADPETTGTAALQSGVHQDAMDELFVRNFRELEGFTADLGQDLSRELLDGFSQGEGADPIARRIRDTVGSATGDQQTGYMARSTRIARTEVMRAHNVSSVNRYQQFGVEKVDILLSPDACDRCQALKDGGPYEISEGRGLLPEHPNCRCAVAAHTGV